MMAGLAYACLFVCIGTSFGCNLNQAQQTGTTCLTTMLTALQRDDACSAWSTYECCLIDGFSAAGCDASQADAVLASTRSTQPGLADCAPSTCIGSSSSGDRNDNNSVSSGSSGSEGVSSSGSSGCDLTVAQATGNACLTAMTQSFAGGDVCGAWSTFECCLKDGYSAAGCETSQANTLLSTTRSINPALADCASPTCSGISSGDQSEPSEVTTTLTGHVHYPASFDPTTFDINTYIESRLQ
jgi:hypothetical protein